VPPQLRQRMETEPVPLHELHRMGLKNPETRFPVPRHGAQRPATTPVPEQFGQLTRVILGRLPGLPKGQPYAIGVPMRMPSSSNRRRDAERDKLAPDRGDPRVSVRIRGWLEWILFMRPFGCGVVGGCI
jgi:hypothetical protein